MTPPANCSEFIPPSWKVPVESAPLPKADTAQGWQGFGVGQTGQLVKANGRQADTVHIFETCEKRAKTCTLTQRPAIRTASNTHGTLTSAKRFV
jgi:hypothetical protein